MGIFDSKEEIDLRKLVYATRGLRAAQNMANYLKCLELEKSGILKDNDLKVIKSKIIKSIERDDKERDQF